MHGEIEEPTTDEPHRPWELRLRDALVAAARRRNEQRICTRPRPSPAKRT